MNLNFENPINQEELKKRKESAVPEVDAIFDTPLSEINLKQRTQETIDQQLQKHLTKQNINPAPRQEATLEDSLQRITDSL